MPSLPRLLLPMLPSRVEEPFDSADHVFELKWEGIRALARVERGRVALISRSGRDLSGWFPELGGIAAQVRSDGCVLDGEIVALDQDGQPDLHLLSSRLAGGPRDDGVACVYQAYDALFERGAPLIDAPLVKRKQALGRLLAAPGPALIVDSVDGDGVALFEAAAERRLPGIVAKSKVSPYVPGHQTSDWLEVAAFESGLFVVGGYALGLGREDAVAALLLGEPLGGGRLRYAGLVQGNLPGGPLEPMLTSNATETCPFVAAPPVPRLLYWTRPDIVCQVRFARRMADGRLRFPVFVAMRPDIAARDLRGGESAARTSAR